jgi:hypothetical protein
MFQAGYQFIDFLKEAKLFKPMQNENVVQYFYDPGFGL